MSAVTAALPTSLEENIDADDETPGIPLSRRFNLGLLGLVVLGVGARLFFVFRWTYGKPLPAGTDPLFFQMSVHRLRAVWDM